MLTVISLCRRKNTRRSSRAGGLPEQVTSQLFDTIKFRQEHSGTCLNLDTIVTCTTELGWVIHLGITRSSVESSCRRNGTVIILVLLAGSGWGKLARESSSIRVLPVDLTPPPCLLSSASTRSRHYSCNHIEVRTS
jgi:hypothetical protein